MHITGYYAYCFSSSYLRTINHPTGRPKGWFDKLNLFNHLILKPMEVITISSDAYNALIQKIDNIANVVSKANLNNQPLSERWLDIQEACQTLKISKRTLQAYRDKKVLPYSQIAGKIYFKAADIEAHLQKHYNKNA